MHTEFRRADPHNEIHSLLLFDRAVFRAADRFPRDYWFDLVSFWMLIDGRKAGCCAFECDAGFGEDGEIVPIKGSLYIATTGIHPRFQSLGLGRLLKSWQICYARRHGYHRLVTNVRSRNTPMIELNESFGFQRIRTIPRYYTRPTDSTLVMELILRPGGRA